MKSRLLVLIVDDSRSLRKMIEAALTESGFDVMACEHGEEALQASRTKSVDVIVTDLNMPGIGGIELARRFRAESSTAHCPILVLTTDNSEQRKQEARQAGVSGWVLKPFQPATLVRAIQQVSKRKQVLA